MSEPRKYEFELHQDAKSLDRIHTFFRYLWRTLRLQNEDSAESVNGGASVHYKIVISVEEEWM